MKTPTPIVNLAAVVSEKRSGRRTRFRVASTEPSRAADIGYLTAMRRFVRAAWAAVQADVLPAVEKARTRARDGLTRDDAGTDEALRKFERLLARKLTRTAYETVERVLRLERRRNTKQFVTAVKSSLGIDLSAVITEGGLEEQFQAILKRNADLITKLADTTREKVRLAVEEAVISGMPVKDLKDRLAHDFGVLDSRAKLIARDQVAKANSDLNQLRQQQVGVEEYEWSSSRDERVRPLHRELNGRTFRWDQPGPDAGLHPGQPIQCRCVAIAVINL